MTSLFKQGEYYNGYDNPNLAPKGGLAVEIVGANDQESFELPPPLPADKATAVTGNLETTNVVVALNAPSSRVQVKTDNGSSTSAAYATFDGSVATTTNGFRIDPGGTFEYEGPPIETVNIIADTAAGTYSVFAQ